MDFTIIERAGITQAQFAELVGVARGTVNTWVTGKMHPCRAVRQKVRFATKLLEDAIARGQLPVQIDRRKIVDERLDPIADRVAAAEA